MLMFDFMPFIITMMILIYVVIYLMMDDNEGDDEDDDEVFVRRTEDAYDRVIKSDEEFSVDEFLEMIRKW